MPKIKESAKVWIKWFDEATESIKEEECYFHLFDPGLVERGPVFIFKNEDGKFRVEVDDLMSIKFLED